MRIAEHPEAGRVAAVMVPIEGATRGGNLVAAARNLHRAARHLDAIGYELVLLPADLDFRLKRPRRRWWAR